MMALDLEGACRVAEDFDLTGGVCLDPDGRVAFPRVAQQRTEVQFGRHAGILPAAGSLVPEQSILVMGMGGRRYRTASLARYLRSGSPSLLLESHSSCARPAATLPLFRAPRSRAHRPP